MPFKILKYGKELKYGSFVFPGGEVSVKLDVDNHGYKFFTHPEYPKINHQTIIARIQSSKDVMELIMLKDALKRFDDTPIHLFMPKIPYAQQDRVCQKGESFSLKAFAQIINILNFNEVKVIDPHSDVSNAVFNHLNIISQLDVIGKFDALNKYIHETRSIFVAPDAGSNKKVSGLAKYYGHSDFIRADKLRDLSNGNIKECIVYAEDLKGQNIVICDDICLGGQTFIGLAKALKSKNAGKIALFVSHGVFSKGFNALFDAGIDHIFTTDSWGGAEQWNLHEKVTCLELESVFNV